MNKISISIPKLWESGNVLNVDLQITPSISKLEDTNAYTKYH